MPVKVSMRQVDKNLNAIKGSLPPKFHPNLEKTRAQVTALNSSLIDANAVIKQKDGELKTQTAAITEINTDIGAISKQINAFDKKILVLESDAKVAEARNVKLTKDVLLKNNEVLKLKADLANMNKIYLNALKANQAYKAQVANLTSENNKLRELYEAIKAQKKRPIATPTQLSSSFKNAMEAMRSELKTIEESPVDYVISKFDVELKTGIGVDEKDNVNFQLPKEEEMTKPENLSTIQFSIRAIPKGKLEE